MALIDLYVGVPQMKKIVALFLLSVFVLTFSDHGIAQREPVPQNPSQTEKPLETSENPTRANKQRIREGTTFKDKIGFFRQVGQRTIFQTLDGNERYFCLENLTLERALKAIEDKPTRTLWRIDGTYTEFQGDNYILLQRALAASASR